MDKKDKIISDLQTVGCLALGYALAKDGMTGPMARPLAQALRDSGVDSVYITAILGPVESKDVVG